MMTKQETLRKLTRELDEVIGLLSEASDHLFQLRAEWNEALGEERRLELANDGLQVALKELEHQVEGEA